MQVWRGDNKIEQKRRWDIEYATTTIKNNKRKGQEKRRHACGFRPGTARLSCTHARNDIQVKFSVQGLNNNTEKQQIEENIRQLLKQPPLPASTVQYSHHVTPEQHMVQTTAAARQGRKDRQMSQASKTLIAIAADFFQYITPETVLPIVLKLSGPAPLSPRADEAGIQPPAWASQTSNLFAPAPMESMPMPNPVK